MFVLSSIALVFGYVLASRVLGERDGYLRIPLAYALGLSCFLFGVNAFFHALVLTSAVIATLGLMVVAAAALWPLESRPAVWPRLGRLEAAVVIVLALTAFFRALFWQMKHSDDDFFPHAPLMALYLQNVFPPQNPFYPDQPYLGHYGRDLSISALSVLWGERFFAVQYAVTALNHAMTVLLAYFASRRLLASRRQALLVVTLVFLGLNSFQGRSLMDVFSNNNTFVYLFLFLTAYVFVSVLRCPRPGAAVVSTVCLATYSIVYTTHHAVLIAAFPLLTLAVLISSRRWRMLRLVTSGGIVVGSLAISLLHGGTLTDLGQRHLGAAKPGVADGQQSALVTQRIVITFPKGRLGFTAGDGTSFSLFSRRFLEDTGFPAVFLPATIALLFVARRHWSLLLGLVGMMAILLPATIHFGAYENDTYRFLFLGGLGSAAALATVVGLALDRVAGAGRVPLPARLAVAGLLLLSCWSSVAGTARAFGDVARRPDQYFLSAVDAACNGIHRHVCDPIDASAALAMRSLVQPGERILTNLYNEADLDFVGQAVISAFARAPLTGLGAHVPGDPAIRVGQQYKTPAGFRALAFWATGVPRFLEDLRADWLLVDPSRLSSRVRAALARNPQLHLVHREDDEARGGVRELLRVERGAPKAMEHSPRDLTLVHMALPARVEPARLLEVPFVVETRDRSFTGHVSVGAVVRAGPVTINHGDLVRHEVQLAPEGRGRWSGSVTLVSPFEPGDYEVGLVAGRGESPLPDPAGGASLRPIRVGAHSCSS
jgi:hypothetical protein